MAELHDLLVEGTPERVLADKYGTVSELAKGYQALLSSNKTHKGSPPSETASPSELREFYTKLGAPASPEGYVVPEGAAELGEARTAAYESGVTGKQWDAVASQIMAAKAAHASASSQEAEARVEGWRAKSREEFGDRLDEVVAKVDRYYDHLKVEHPEIGDALDDRISHPEVMRLILGLAESDSHEIPMGGGRTAGPAGPQALVAKIRTLMATEAWRNPRHPERQTVMSDYKSAQQALVEAGYEGIHDPQLSA